jgi:hypothetical protein
VAGNDVEIQFSDEPHDDDPDVRDWNETEIASVDQAFRLLYNKAQTTLILKDPNAGSNPGDHALTFFKATERDDWNGRNRPDSDGNRIFIEDWDETTNDRHNVVIHEVGHNWDQWKEARHHPNHDSWYYWGAFRDLSNDSEDITRDELQAELDADSSRTTDYARSYGAKHRREDWCTIWEHVVNNRPIDGTPTGLLREKIAVVERFFATFV